MNNYLLPDGRTIQDGVSFEFPDGSIARQRNWLSCLSSDELSALGITTLEPPPQPVTPTFDPLTYKLVDGVLVQKSLEEVKSTLKDQIAAKRWELENAGIDWNSNIVYTDAKSRGNYLGLVVAVDKGLRIDNGVYKHMSGPAPLANTDVASLALGVMQYIQTLYDKEAEFGTQIDALQTFDDLVNFTWDFGVTPPVLNT